jgi:hypothetical protein
MAGGVVIASYCSRKGEGLVKKFAAMSVVAAVFVLAGTASAATGGTSLPFAVSGSGSIDQIGTFGSLSGSAGALHMGSGSFSGSVVTEGFPPACGRGTLNNFGSLVLTAANGDKVYENVDQFVCQSGPSQTYDGTGTYTITGGTGRFADATGSGAISFQVVFPGPSPAGIGSDNFKQNGTISLNEPVS